LSDCPSRPSQEEPLQDDRDTTRSCQTHLFGEITMRTYRSQTVHHRRKDRSRIHSSILERCHSFFASAWTLKYSLAR
jgi:hypothetical protein